MKYLFLIVCFVCCFPALSQVDKPRDVSFAIKEEKAIFPGCEEVGSSLAREKCTQQKIYQFIGQHIDSDIAVKQKIRGKHRVRVAITIDKEGRISKLESNSDNKKITKAIKKAFKNLPQMIPFKTDNRPGSTRLILPITFIGTS
jgi:protein TonB